MAGGCRCLSVGEPNKDLTKLLKDFGSGSAEALHKLYPQVHEHLHRLAMRYMSRENPGHTLQPTALVHEAFLRLVEGKQVEWQDRTHFFAVAARMMRHILTDHAKAKRAEKRGGGGIKVSFDEKLHAAQAPQEGDDLLALDAALEKLKGMNERQAQVVELRYFGGLSIEETSECLQSSPATIKRDWNSAKLWLFRELNKTKNG
jgi:RNA polymerase sigma factor (TIGR02999 family)